VTDFEGLAAMIEHMIAKMHANEEVKAIQDVSPP
jgi:hypothetical protein